MKSASLFAITAFIITAADAFAAAPHMYANTVSVHNIGAIQHSIMLGAMQSFEGSVSAALGSRAKIVTPALQEENADKNSADLYGRMPLYGTMHLYGEYGDDGSVYKKGRSGGDALQRPVINSIWINWQHFGDDLKFKHYDRLDSDYDLIMFGLAGGEAQLGNGISEWGLYGGYVGGTQENKFLNIDENGGYFGLYAGYNIKNFNLSASVNAGALYNRAENEFGTDEYANMWAGGALNATYNIALDNTFTLQPGVYAGYTWVKSANYVSHSGDNVANQNFAVFEVAPALRAIKHIGKGWFGFIGFRYTFAFANGAEAILNGVNLSELDTDNYAEYGIGIEKSIDRFNVSLNFNRRDGGRAGWNGGLNLKYIF